ncbi:class I SAM-dependent methyltransferase [Paenibacillus radicis (ex Xue et al. 2023)]|uniref:Class I SAM-dependent methyltransferase n=1 Tax=Paenibacillus radicis (ex Xue et al. 2023) TaxID=2972489 RepID=A0ABT1YF90_9BACL|nr:class I SAM-dependent methyltransferase [Paenibacillus radicis (ex Xue et al. 2023)]MCR8631079.1 class I SAM-dependent methyltransferase [Paenibacillus radicis (ex Xue et al. 2023)]
MSKSKRYEQTGVAMTCRSFAEYEKMFALGQLTALDGPILDVAAGASSFTAEACARGINAKSADPLYSMNADEIMSHGGQEIITSTQKLAAIKESFDWSYYGDLDRHRALREQSLVRFIQDYRQYKEEGRYVPALLPKLPYEDGTFNLVLCSHFLFLYHEQFDYEFHLQAIQELLRVCRPGGQVRIYPLRSLQWDYYPHLEQLLSTLEKEQIKTRLLASELPFIPGSTELLSLAK